MYNNVAIFEKYVSQPSDNINFSIESFFDDILDKTCIYTIDNTSIHTQCNKYMPSIKRVIYNKNSTIVLFDDGTKTIVSASKEDTYNKEVGLMYAIVKRFFAKTDPKTNELDYSGFSNYIKKLVKNADDQNLNGASNSKKKQARYNRNKNKKNH